MKYIKLSYNTFKKIGNAVYLFLILAVLLTGILAFLSTTSIFHGFQLYSVSSGSMEPAISTGSLVAIYPFSTYKKGEVITFSSDKNISGITTTHRLVGIETADNMEFYETQGDANSTPDSQKINKEAVLGKVIFHIPYIGYLVTYTRTVNGVIFLIVIPSVLIIYDELLKLKNEIKKVLIQKNENKNY